MADPATQFHSAGIVSPSPSPVVTQLHAPISLPYISKWDGVAKAIQDATNTIMNSRLNPYVRAKQDAEIAKNKVIQDAWTRKLAEGTAGYATEKFGPEGVETYGVDTTGTTGNARTYDTRRKSERTQTQQPTEQVSQADQVKLNNLIQQKHGDHDSPFKDPVIDKDGNYTYTSADGKTVFPLSKQDALTLLKQNSDQSSTNKTTTVQPNPPNPPNPPGQHSGFAYNPSNPPGVDDFSQYPSQYATV